jgi:hypothetical protein
MGMGCLMLCQKEDPSGGKIFSAWWRIIGVSHDVRFIMVHLCCFGRIFGQKESLCVTDFLDSSLSLAMKIYLWQPWFNKGR